MLRDCLSVILWQETHYSLQEDFKECVGKKWIPFHYILWVLLIKDTGQNVFYLIYQKLCYDDTQHDAGHEMEC